MRHVQPHPGEKRIRPDVRDATTGARGRRPDRDAMSAPRVLLLEVLDAIGSATTDAREHCAVLQAARMGVQAATLSPGDRNGSVGSETGKAAAAFPAFGDGRADHAALRDFARRGRFDLALVAAASPGGGRAAHTLSRTLPTRWWPTGLTAARGWRSPWVFAGSGVRAMVPADLADDGPGPRAPAGLAWSSVEGGRLARGRLTPWDGEYVLAPLPLAGDDGVRTLAGFAQAAARWSALDLIVLAEPQPAFEREARVRGIGARVHFVGRAPREAEWAWWSHASAALLAGRGPVSGGLILRGLTAGCPLLVASASGPCDAVAGWLTEHGCMPWADTGSAPGEGLAQILERGPSVDQAVTRGRTLAARHDPTRLGQGLAPALARLWRATPETPRAAAA